jgi:hypothetical protein
MIPHDRRIVGIASVAFDPADGELRLRVALDDGSIAACWWSAEMLAQSMSVVSEPTHAPADARLQ